VCHGSMHVPDGLVWTAACARRTLVRRSTFTVGSFWMVSAAALARTSLTNCELKPPARMSTLVEQVPVGMGAFARSCIPVPTS
jgi:hypothetical protein